MTAENMLHNIVPSGGGAIIAEYIYNPDGSRHYKRTHGLAGEQVHFYHAQYPFDDGTLAQEILETANNTGWNLAGNEVLRRYVRLPGSIDEAILMIDYTVGNLDGGDPGTEIYAHFNRQGSVIATSDANGNIQDKYTYSPYGVSGTTNSGFPFRFTGQRLDAETGLYYYKARYYDAETGRFLQTDPIGYEDQQNLYAYVGNDPINLFDPSGLEIECARSGNENKGATCHNDRTGNS